MVATGLFDPIFTSDAMAAATSDTSWLQALLDFEAGLAYAGAAAGVIPARAAVEIASACVVEHFDIDALGRAGRLAGSPVVPLVAALRHQVPEPAASWVHYGATSQDVLDTATMLVIRRAAEVLAADLVGIAEAAARLADEHRSTVMVARTLLQSALPTTFGAKAAGWLVATLDAADILDHLRCHRLAIQLGGAAGTLASLGHRGPEVAHHLAERLGLAMPLAPWHTDRTRLAEVASAVSIATGTAGKVALDVSLMMQGEVAEVYEPADQERGGSSTLPQKRNPVLSVAALASARRVPALASVLVGSMLQEHERAAGAWHAEWLTLTELLRAAGGVSANVCEVMSGLEVDPARMRANLDSTRGLVMAERVAVALARHLGVSPAWALVEAASRQAAERQTSLREELGSAMGDAARAGGLVDLDELFDPQGYLGAVPEHIDAALERHRRRSIEEGMR